MNASVGNHNDCIAAIQPIVGDAHVRPATADDVIDGVQPHFIVEPASGDEVAQVLRLANSAGLRVIARGGGTKLDWGNSPSGVDIVLSTRRLDRVLEHAAGDMTATVQAGCTVAALNTTLAQHGQRLALDPLWPQRATVGGILAANDSGALRAAFGSLRDHLIGVTVVLADGTVARSGGKVVKNVAGYDLPKLFTGSFGTLGVITEAVFRLYPVAHAIESLRFVVPTHDALGSTLSALKECSLVTSSVQIEADDSGLLNLSIRVEGLPEAIRAKTQRVIRAAAEHGSQQVDVPADVWDARERLFHDPQSCVAKVCLLPTHWPAFLEQIRDLAARAGGQWQAIGQAVGVGLVRLTIPHPAQAMDAITTLRSALQTMGGSLTLLHCPPEIKQQIDVWPDVGNALPLMRRIKEQFDPKGVLSPGRFVGGI